MMSDQTHQVSFVVDCAGLHEIASTQSNSVKSVCIENLANGTIIVPSCVWQEFKEAYEEEAASLAAHVGRKLNMKRAYLIGGAAIADSLNSGFSLSPYDRKSDYYAASICSIEGHTLITATSQIAEYQRMNCCAVVDVVTWSASF